jgi:hypothetical protein
MPPSAREPRRGPAPARRALLSSGRPRNVPRRCAVRFVALRRPRAFGRRSAPARGPRRRRARTVRASRNGGRKRGSSCPPGLWRPRARHGDRPRAHALQATCRPRRAKGAGGEIGASRPGEAESATPPLMRGSSSECDFRARGLRNRHHTPSSAARGTPRRPGTVLAVVSASSHKQRDLPEVGSTPRRRSHDARQTTTRHDGPSKRRRVRLFPSNGGFRP